MGGGLRRPGASILGVLVLSAMLVATPAGRRPFWSSDEARFALLAQDVVDHGRWLVAELRGRYYLNKPQLFFWAVAAAALPFGRVTEASAAIPALVSSLCGVAGVIAIGRLLWGWQAGAVAGLILATTPLYFEMGHQVLPDGMLNAWLVWALYWLLKAERAGWPLPPVLAFYGCVTAALLSKGPVALFPFFAPVVFIGAFPEYDFKKALIFFPLFFLVTAGIIPCVVIFFYAQLALFGCRRKLIHFGDKLQQ